MKKEQTHIAIIQDGLTPKEMAELMSQYDSFYHLIPSWVKKVTLYKVDYSENWKGGVRIHIALSDMCDHSYIKSFSKMSGNLFNFISIRLIDGELCLDFDRKKE